MVIGLLTDFGTRDYFVAAMKGAILSINQSAQILDISHEIPPQDIKSAAFTLRACYRDFPGKTIFVTVVDPGVGSKRRPILVETQSYYFIAPDNGLLSFIFEDSKSARVFEITNNKYYAERVSRTFHGRDIFAPAAAYLSNGVLPGEFGGEINDFVQFSTQNPPKFTSFETEAEIIHIDRFGNLVTNIKTKDLPEKFFLEINGQKIKSLRNYFAEAEGGEIFMIEGSAGFLEIAVYKKSAAELLKAKVGQKIGFVKIV